MSIKIVNIEFDEADNPSCEDGWKLYSFNIRTTTYKDFINKYSGDNEVFLKAALAESLAFPLDYYSHGQSFWYLNGECPIDCPWDLVKKAGLIIWENEVEGLGPRTPEDRRNDARLFLQTYNDWMNGNCFSYFIEDENGQLIDSCGGIIGEDLIIEMINEQLDSNDSIILKGKAVEFVSSHKLKCSVCEEAISL